MIKLTNILNESVNEAISRDAAYIHGILQSGQDATQNFIDDNGLDGEKLSDYVKANRNNIDGYNVKHYISGERGTVGSVPKLRQAFIKKFKKGKSVKEAKAIGKKIFSDAKGKLFFGYQNDDDTVQLVDYKTWKKLSMKDLSNEFLANRVINSILKNQKQFNKKVEYNMWSKKTNPSFEDRMDYFIKNNWISNITKIGIKESVDSLNEENEPTNPALWDKAIAAAKRKYDVYPSAYANAFASKWYKEKGGDWKTKKESVNESAKSDKLAILITKVIDKVDSSLSYKDFAMAVGKILKDDYGSHVYSIFLQELNKELKRENENLSKLTTYLPTETKSIEESLTVSIKNLINDLVPRDIQNAITPQQQERRQSFIRDLVKTLNQFYKQNRIDWRFADSNIKFKMYSKD